MNALYNRIESIANGLDPRFDYLENSLKLVTAQRVLLDKTTAADVINALLEFEATQKELSIEEMDEKHRWIKTMLDMALQSKKVTTLDIDTARSLADTKAVRLYETLLVMHSAVTTDEIKINWAKNAIDANTHQTLVNTMTLAKTAPTIKSNWMLKQLDLARGSSSDNNSSSSFESNLATKPNQMDEGLLVIGGAATLIGASTLACHIAIGIAGATVAAIAWPATVAIACIAITAVALYFTYKAVNRYMDNCSPKPVQAPFFGACINGQRVEAETAPTVASA
ncbi:MAG: hypothetical protein Q7V63_02720 [Gammaproteobacteria bacterium]|nr:hypothetical protein [Gammaproteobacteria bacterium]